MTQQEAEAILQVMGWAARPANAAPQQPAQLKGASPRGESPTPNAARVAKEPAPRAIAPAEARLRKAEARYRTLVEQIPAVTFMASLDEGINELYVSPQIEALLGFSQKEWLEDPILWYTRLHPDDRERWHVEFARTCAAGTRFRSEYRFLARDGRVVWVHGEAQVVRDDQGHPLFIQGIAYDITESKRAVETLHALNETLERRVAERTAAAEQRSRELHTSETRLRAILDNALDAVIIIDAAGAITGWNPQAEVMFGWSRAEALGRRLGDTIIPERYREAHRQGVQRFFATGEGPVLNRRIEITALRRNGEEFPIELAVAPVRWKETFLFSAFLSDITERKRADEQLRFYAAELQQRNTELLRSNQELDDFAYIASHDLKEPLRGIHNYAGFLIEDYGDKLDAAGRAKLETLKHLSRRLGDLLDSLLEFSRVGRVDLAVQPTDLNELVAEVVDSLHILLEERGVAIRIPRPLPVIRCDRVRVHEVFRNLIANAIKYNDKQEKWIEIGVQPSGPVFYVRDNGIGIRARHFEAIFRIFKRLHGRDQFGGGIGAGLSIVKKIIERHGGRIWVESTVGEGATFYFTLPEKERASHGHSGASDPAG